MIEVGSEAPDFILPDENGKYVLLNGNQTCVLLTYYLLRRWSELGRLNGHQYNWRIVSIEL